MPPNSPPRVVCYMPYGSWLVHNQHDCVVGTALRVRGVEATILTCDGLFQKNCYVLAHSKNQAADCASCSSTGLNFFSQFPLPLLQLRQFSQDADWAEAENWLGHQEIQDLSGAVFNGLPVGEWVRPSVRSYYVVNPRNLQRPEVQALFRLYIRYTIMTYRALQRFMNEFQPTHLFTFGGYGFLHAPALHLIAERGGHYVTNERGQLPSRFMVAADIPVDAPEAIIPALDGWEGVPFTLDDFETVRKVFQDFELGTNRIGGNFYKYTSNDSKARSSLGIPADATIISIFTSGEHELGTAEQRRVVGRQLEMISNLIEVFRGRPEYLVIRHHPGLGVGVRSRLDYNYLSRAYLQATDLPPNVRVIMPNEQLTSYSLLWNSTACLTTLSTVTVEAGARGIPVATLPISIFHRSATTTIGEFSVAALRDTVNELIATAANRRDIVVRKAYSFLRCQLLKFSTAFKSFGIKNTHEMDLRITSTSQLVPGIDPALDRLCDFVMRGTSVLDLPTQEDRNRDRATEDRCFAEECKNIEQRKDQIREATRTIVEDLRKTHVICFSSTTDSTDRESILKKLGLFQQRNAPISTQVIPDSAMSFSEKIKLLDSYLESCGAEYVIVTNSRFRYDEDFIRHGRSVISDSPGKLGVLCGAWIWKGEEIKTHLLLGKDSANSLNSISELVERPLSAIDFLGFGMFNVHELRANLSMLGGLPQFKDISEAQQAELFLALMTCEKMVAVEAPKIHI